MVDWKKALLIASPGIVLFVESLLRHLAVRFFRWDWRDPEWTATVRGFRGR